MKQFDARTLTLAMDDVNLQRHRKSKNMIAELTGLSVSSLCHCTPDEVVEFAAH